MNFAEKLFCVSGKKAIVTGGARGLGYSMAEGLHNAGAEVVLIATNEERLKQTAEKLGRTGAKVSYVVGDLGKTGKNRRNFSKCLEKVRWTNRYPGE